MFYLAGIILSFALGVFNTAIQSEISKESDQSEQGVVLGTVQGFGSLARAIGPLVGGILFQQISISAPFITAGIFLFLISMYVQYI